VRQRFSGGLSFRSRQRGALALGSHSQRGGGGTMGSQEQALRALLQARQGEGGVGGRGGGEQGERRAVRLRYAPGSPSQESCILLEGSDSGQESPEGPFPDPGARAGAGAGVRRERTQGVLRGPGTHLP